MINIENIVDSYKKIPTSLFITVGILLAIILFSPTNFAESIGIKDFRESYRVFIGPVWLLFIAILISRCIGLLQDINTERKMSKNRYMILTRLTPDEKECLKEFIIGNVPTIYRSINDSAICSLHAQKIVYLASRSSFSINGFPYCLQPWAKEELLKKPELLN